MCGICCYIGFDKGFEITINGLKLLLNRGYDSCGCATLEKHNDEYKIKSRKYANTDEIKSIDLLEKDAQVFENSYILIQHTRWLTTGAKTNENAHPHLDYKERLALVHNGIIENYLELKNDLIGKGITFKSETDTEVIVNLISFLYDQYNNLENAIEKATELMHGTWAFALISTDYPDNIYCSRYGSPLLIGFGNNFMMIASEQTAFAQYTDKYICLNENDIIVLKRENNQVNFSKKHSYEFKKVIIQDFVNKPDPYPHWTIKEIKEQEDSSKRAINYGARILNDDSVKLGGIDRYRNELLDVDHLLLLACGTSYHAALQGVFFFKYLANFTTVQAFDAGEFSELDIPRNGKTVLVLLSQSGETKDVHRCIAIAKRYDLFTIGIVNVVDSLIAREVNCGCYLNAGREFAVASTKSFTSQVIVLSLLAIWFSQQKEINSNKRMAFISDLRKLSDDIKNVIQLTEHKCQQVANFLNDKTSCFVLGKGEMESYSLEGALKIKEISYLHAEGYSAVALKHGPFSLLDGNVPVIIIDCSHNLEDASRIASTIGEIKSRNTPIILISDRETNNNDYFVINVPVNKTYRGILSIIPMQLIAYYLAISKGINPDMPRNLAKCISVF